MRRQTKESGLLSLEASICLTLFIFLMLFMYSFFVVFEARNVIAHATLATTKSMALDVYETEKVTGSRDMASWLGPILQKTFTDDSPFVSRSRWFTLDTVSTTWNENIYAAPGTDGDSDYSDDYGNTAYVSQLFGDEIKSKFCAYLAGTAEPSDADKYLKRYHIANGFSGIDFSKSKIVGGDLYVVINYEIEYEFDIFHLVDPKLEQSACSKIWK